MTNLEKAHIVGKESAQAQDDNCHTECQIIIAEAFGNDVHLASLKSIGRDHESFGYMPEWLSHERNKLSKELSTYIRDTNPMVFDILNEYDVLYSPFPIK